MSLKELLVKRETLQGEIVTCLEDELSDIKSAADNMVECATNMKGQGYSSFIASREEFLGKVEKLRGGLAERI